MPELGFTSGFVDAFIAFALALAVFGVGLFIYTTITPFKETQLIRAGNAAASLNFSTTVLALGLPIAAAVHNTHNTMEIAIWGANAVLFQLLAYVLFTRIFPETNKAIEEGHAIKIVPLCALQLTVALLNAAVFAG